MNDLLEYVHDAEIRSIEILLSSESKKIELLIGDVFASMVDREKYTERSAVLTLSNVTSIDGNFETNIIEKNIGIYSIDLCHEKNAMEIRFIPEGRLTIACSVLRADLSIRLIPN